VAVPMPARLSLSLSRFRFRNPAIRHSGAAVLERRSRPSSPTSGSGHTRARPAEPSTGFSHPPSRSPLAIPMSRAARNCASTSFASFIGELVRTQAEYTLSPCGISFKCYLSSTVEEYGRLRRLGRARPSKRARQPSRESERAEKAPASVSSRITCSLRPPFTCSPTSSSKV